MFIILTSRSISKSVLQSSTELVCAGYLYMYSGFVYFSLCCVLYKGPPLTDQVLGKVLLTSWEIS